MPGPPASPPPSSAGGHEHRLRVRYAETDQMGRVHHASFVVYLEEARTRSMEALGCSYAALERAGIGLVVRSLELRYRAAALYDDELVVTTRVELVRGASVKLGYAVEREADGGRELVATGSTHLACVDLRADPPAVRELPDEARAAFERGLAEG